MVANQYPVVSIILPTYNGKNRIGRAIKSVLAQTLQDWELIVVDDASTENVKDSIDKYADTRIRFLKQGSNQGIQKALNRGILEAKGQYIARIDDDDSWVDVNKLHFQVEYFRANPECVLVGTGVIVEDEKGIELNRYIFPESDMAIRSRILSKNCFAHASVMYRSDTVRKAGGYSEYKSTLHAEDYDLWLRLGTIGAFANISIFATKLTVRSLSVTSRFRVRQAWNILKVSWKFRTRYPNQYKGFFVCLTRLFGFAVLRVVPFPRRLLYWIQGMQKEA